MQFTASDIVTILSAVGVLVGIIATNVINIINARELKAAVGVVSNHVNSAASASVTKIETLQNELKGLHATIAEGKQTAALLAQSTATNPPPPPPIQMREIP